MTNGRVFAVNRKARFEYEILETHEAGLALIGTEIKAIREGRASLSGAYARPNGGEIWLMNSHISRYSAAGTGPHDPTRPRKLLLHKGEIAHLSRDVAEKGLTLVPLRLYLKRHVAKVELGLARGRKQYDKRRLIQERDRAREARQGLRRRG